MTAMTFSRHPIQFTFVTLQCGIVLIGTLLTKHTLNASGFPDQSVRWHPLPIFLREYSLALILIPCAWGVWTIWEEHSRGLERRYVLASGAILSAAFVFIFFAAMLLASGVIRHF